MNRILLLLLLSLSAFSGLNAQNLVSSPERRQETLDRLGEVLRDKSVHVDVAQLGRVSPFSPLEVAAAVVTTNTTATATVVSAAPPVDLRPSDRMALAAVAPRFRPSGAIVTSARSVLRMSDGSLYEEGRQMPFRIRDHEFILQIEAVTADGYTLRIGTAHLTRKFLEQDQDVSSSIVVDNPGN